MGRCCRAFTFTFPAVGNAAPWAARAALVSIILNNNGVCWWLEQPPLSPTSFSFVFFPFVLVCFFNTQALLPPAGTPCLSFGGCSTGRRGALVLFGTSTNNNFNPSLVRGTTGMVGPSQQEPGLVMVEAWFPAGNAPRVGLRQFSFGRCCAGRRGALILFGTSTNNNFNPSMVRGTTGMVGPSQQEPGLVMVEAWFPAGNAPARVGLLRQISSERCCIGRRGAFVLFGTSTNNNFTPSVVRGTTGVVGNGINFLDCSVKVQVQTTNCKQFICVVLRAFCTTLQISPSIDDFIFILNQSLLKNILQVWVIVAC